MNYKNEEQKIRTALDQKVQIPEQILNRVQETYRELGLTEENSDADVLKNNEEGTKDTKIVTMKRHKKHKKPRMINYMFVAALTLFVGVTVYAIQSSIISQLAQKYRDAYESFDENNKHLLDTEDDELQTALEEDKEKYKQNAERYEKADQSSNKEKQVYSLSELIGNSVVKEESYYDGNDFILIVSLDAVREPIQYGFGPGNDNFDQLWCSDLNVLKDMQEKIQDDSLSEEDMEFYQELYESKKASAANYDGKFDEQMKECIGNGLITEEEAAKLKEIYKEQGSVGFIAHEIYIGDHVLLPDGTDLTVSGQTLESDTYVIEPFEGVTPDTAWNRDALDLVLQVKRAESYHYIDEDANYFCYYEPGESEKVTVTLENVNK